MSIVIYRGEDESVILYTASGEQIIVTMEGEQHGQYKMRFVAPSSVSIVCEELMDVTLDQFMARALA